MPWRRAAKIFCIGRHFLIDATLCRVYYGDIDFKNGSKKMKQSAIQCALFALYLIAALALDAFIFGPQF